MSTTMSGSALPKLDTHHPSDLGCFQNLHNTIGYIGYVSQTILPALRLASEVRNSGAYLASGRKLNLNDYINKLFEVKML